MKLVVGLVGNATGCGVCRCAIGWEVEAAPEGLEGNDDEDGGHDPSNRAGVLLVQKDRGVHRPRRRHHGAVGVDLFRDCFDSKIVYRWGWVRPSPNEEYDKRQHDPAKGPKSRVEQSPDLDRPSKKLRVVRERQAPQGQEEAAPEEQDHGGEHQ